MAEHRLCISGAPRPVDVLRVRVVKGTIAKEEKVNFRALFAAYPQKESVP